MQLIVTYDQFLLVRDALNVALAAKKSDPMTFLIVYTASGGLIVHVVFIPETSSEGTGFTLVPRPNEAFQVTEAVFVAGNPTAIKVNTIDNS
mgnify:CR=1 FL=1